MSNPHLIPGHVLVRVLRDIPTFVGYNHIVYSLNVNDIATIPKINSIGLIKKGAVREINQEVIT